MNKPFQPDVWEQLRVIANDKAEKLVSQGEALEIIREIQAGSRNPFGPLLSRLNREIQKDHDEERDRQGKPGGEDLWP